MDKVDELYGNLAAGSVNLKNKSCGPPAVYFPLSIQCCFRCEICPYTSCTLMYMSTLAATM